MDKVFAADGNYTISLVAFLEIASQLKSRSIGDSSTAPARNTPLSLSSSSAKASTSSLSVKQVSTSQTKSAPTSGRTSPEASVASAAADMEPGEEVASALLVAQRRGSSSPSHPDRAVRLASMKRPSVRNFRSSKSRMAADDTAIAVPPPIPAADLPPAPQTARVMSSSYDSSPESIRADLARSKEWANAKSDGENTNGRGTLSQSSSASTSSELGEALATARTMGSPYPTVEGLVWDEEVRVEPGIRPLPKAAKLEKLVEELTPTGESNLEYTSFFLMTYRSFTNPSELLQMLIKLFRFDDPNAPVTSGNDKMVRQRRVLRFVKKWVDETFYDFNMTSIAELQEFLDSDVKSAFPIVYESIVHAIKLHSQLTKSSPPSLSSSVDLNDHRLDADEALTIVGTPEGTLRSSQSKSSPSLAILSRTDLSASQSDGRRKTSHSRQNSGKTVESLRAGIDWKRIDIGTFAEQLTLADFAVLRHIHFSELLFWLKPKLRHQSPHVQSFIDRFNKLGSWVATQIVTTTALKQRVRVVATLIQLAKALETLNNFNAVMAILGGINSNAVHRLKFTFEALADDEREALISLSTLMDNNSSFANYRKRLAEAVGPRIPYLGILIQDLLFVDEGSTDLTSDGLINFRKRRRMASYLQELKYVQDCPPEFVIVRDLLDSATRLEPQINEKDQYNESLAREPRQALLKDLL